MLLSAADYAKYEEKITKRDFIAFYGFDDRDNNKILMNKAIQLSKASSLPIIDFSLDYFSWNYDKVERIKVTPGEFLSYIKNGKFIVTNSFHGTVFSIIYNRDFYTLPKSGTSARMVELLVRLGIEKRIIGSCVEDSVELNYSSINSKLKCYALQGIEYLENNLVY